MGTPLEGEVGGSAKALEDAHHMKIFQGNLTLKPLRTFQNCTDSGTL